MGMLFVMCIYAVLAVDLYADYTVIYPDPDNPEITARGDRYSEEYYGTFLKATYTLFQILTGESWSEAGVRPILESSPDIATNVGNALFFISFILINAVVLLNIVVAVLLDGMAEAGATQDEDLFDPEPEVTDGDDTIPDEDDNDDEIRKDMAVLKQQVDTMSMALKEVLSGLHSLEEQQPLSEESQIIKEQL